MPKTLTQMNYQNGVQINEIALVEKFAKFFETKINNLIENAVVCPEVYNGTTKMTIGDVNFMTNEMY